mmetsp:Transcript_20956/g.37728  ORF Transcript_20956/g.37728 Transcript_20956/m.37728 type:complete len:223 (-) Transcript_20956:581-1249(-)
MGEAFVGELVVAIGGDVFHDLPAFADIFVLAGKRDLELLACRSILRHLGDAHLHTNLRLHGLDSGTLFANEVWEAAWVNCHLIFLEVIEGHCAVALLNELLDSPLGLCHCLWLTHNGEDLSGGVDARDAGLLLDQLDLGALWSNDNADLSLWNLHGGCALVALLRFFLSGISLDFCSSSSSCCSSALEHGIHLSLVEFGRRHARDVGLSRPHAWHALAKVLH